MRFLSLVHSWFRQAEVCYFDVPLGVYEEVFGFEIAVDDVLLVEVLDAEEYLDEVEFGLLLRHALDVFEAVEELASGAVCIVEGVH